MEASPIPDRPRKAAAAVVAVALAPGFLVWLFVIRGGADEAPAAAAPRAGGGPVASSAGELSSLQDELGHPVYWAGGRDGSERELTPVEGAFGALQRASRKRGSTAAETTDGGLAVTDEPSPTSVYLAYPGQDLQIEVFDTDPERALDIAVSGDVRPAD